MKTTILSLIALLALTTSNAQTTNSGGGQSPENTVIRMRYAGYQQGNHVFVIKNKRNCVIGITTRVDTEQARDTTIPAQDSIEFKVPKPSAFTQTKFRAKVTEDCVQDPNLGWIEMVVPFASALSLYERDPEYVRERQGMTVKLASVGAVLVTMGDSKNYSVSVEEHDQLGRKLLTTQIRATRSATVTLPRRQQNQITYLVVTVQSNLPHTFTLKRVQQ
jgi:hypothetical protein